MKKFLFLLALTFLTFNISCKKNSTSSENSAPIASFTITPTSGTTTTSFTFDASGSTDKEDATTALQVRWDWNNDGTYDTGFSTTKTTTHKYTDEGNYTIELEVKDGGGLTHKTTKQLIVSSANTAPTASFTVNPATGTSATTFTFDASGCTDNEDAAATLEVRWDWNNDGTYDTNWSTIQTETHQYSSSGTYTVKLEVRDSEGLTNTTTKTVSLSNTAPTASFTVNPTTGTTATTFAFDANGSIDNEDTIVTLEVRWDWENDGTWDTNYSTTKTATHQYSTAGTYTVQLEVKDSEGLTHLAYNQLIVDELVDGTVMDIDGNIYQTVVIGNQLWMAENLKVTQYRNGDKIPNVTGGIEWLNLTTDAQCSYNNDDSNINTYGLLYNSYAVGNSKGLAPAGWHIPSDEEWKQLEMYLGMSQEQAEGYQFRGKDEGSKLKSTSGWYNNGNGTNESGFTVLPGGFRSGLEVAFHAMGTLACFWSSTDYNSIFTWYRALINNDSGVGRSNTNKRYGYSVRCIRD